MAQGGIRGEFGGAQKRMTSRIFPILASLLVAALLLGAADIIVAPNAAVAAPADVCKGKKAERPTECDGDSGDGGGGKTGLLDLEALLVGDFLDKALANNEPQACGTSGVMVGPFDDPDKTQLMNAKFDALVADFGAVLPADLGLEDQLFGFGHSVFNAVSDDLIQIQFLNTSTGSGAVNRVLLEGPPNRNGGGQCLDGNETETIHGSIYLMLGHGGGDLGDCPEGVDLCIMSFMVGARLDNNKIVYGIDEEFMQVTYLEDPIEIQTDACMSTVVPIFDRFRMEQQGKKFVVHGTLSYGELHFWVLPADGTACS